MSKPIRIKWHSRVRVVTEDVSDPDVYVEGMLSDNRILFPETQFQYYGPVMIVSEMYAPEIVKTAAVRMDALGRVSIVVESEV